MAARVRRPQILASLGNRDRMRARLLFVLQRRFELGDTLAQRIGFRPRLGCQLLHGLELIHRRIGYAQVDSTDATNIFILNALVDPRVRY